VRLYFLLIAIAPTLLTLIATDNHPADCVGLLAVRTVVTAEFFS